eukprot:403371358
MKIYKQQIFAICAVLYALALANGNEEFLSDEQRELFSTTITSDPRSCKLTCIDQGQQFCASPQYAQGYCCDKNYNCNQGAECSTQLPAATINSNLKYFPCPYASKCGGSKLITVTNSTSTLQYNRAAGSMTTGDVCGFRLTASNTSAANTIIITFKTLSGAQAFLYSGGSTYETATKQQLVDLNSNGGRYEFQGNERPFLIIQATKTTSSEDFFQLTYQLKLKVIITGSETSTSLVNKIFNTESAGTPFMIIIIIISCIAFSIIGMIIGAFFMYKYLTRNRVSSLQEKGCFIRFMDRTLFRMFRKSGENLQQNASNSIIQDSAREKIHIGESELPMKAAHNLVMIPFNNQFDSSVKQNNESGVTPQNGPQESVKLVIDPRQLQIGNVSPFTVKNSNKNITPITSRTLDTVTNVSDIGKRQVRNNVLPPLVNAKSRQVVPILETIERASLEDLTVKENSVQIPDNKSAFLEYQSNQNLLNNQEDQTARFSNKSNFKLDAFGNYVVSNNVNQFQNSFQVKKFEKPQLRNSKTYQEGGLKAILRNFKDDNFEEDKSYLSNNNPNNFNQDVLKTINYQSRKPFNKIQTAEVDNSMKANNYDKSSNLALNLKTRSIGEINYDIMTPISSTKNYNIIGANQVDQEKATIDDYNYIPQNDFNGGNIKTNFIGNQQKKKKKVKKMGTSNVVIPKTSSWMYDQQNSGQNESKNNLKITGFDVQSSFEEKGLKNNNSKIDDFNDRDYY